MTEPQLPTAEQRALLLDWLTGGDADDDTRAMRGCTAAWIAWLEAEIERLQVERDVLMDCRKGLQRCHECPDTNCCDNMAAADAEGG